MSAQQKDAPAGRQCSAGLILLALALTALLVLGAVLTLAHPASAQGPPPPGQNQPPQRPPSQNPPPARPIPPAQTVPPAQAPTQPGAGVPPAQNVPPPPPGQPAPNQSTDAYLRYMQNVDVRVGQLEISGFPTVRAFVSVTDESGVLVRTLKEGNFTVTENDTAVENLRFGNRDELNLPLAIQFVVDVSGSMGVELDDKGTTPVSLEVEAIRQFVTQLKPADRIGLIIFSDAARTEVPLTTDHQELLRALDQLTGWGQTTLWDGLMLGMESLLTDATPARRALIVLSDGLDNRSMDTPQTVLEFYDDNVMKENRGFSVYALGLGQDIDRVGLGEIARRTGGMYFDSPSAQDLAGMYQNILQQIQSEYLLEYESPVESKPGQIIDVNVAITGVTSMNPGKYTYRSPGLTKALARAFWPGLITVAVLLAILIIATIFKAARRVWITVMITPLEGKDVGISGRGADFGTLESCEVRVPGDPALLPLHASLRESADGFVLEAVDPASPIMIGARLLARKLLRSGDRFTLGYTTFVFNERVARPGSGAELPAELLQGELPPQPQPQLTEAAQVAAAGQVAPAQRKLPTALVAQSGPLAGQRFTLAQGENVIGRTEGTIRPPDSQVSRRHCVITLAAGMATLFDPGSTNGTRLNGAACQPGMPQAVWAGDIVGIGAGEYRLE